MPAVDYDTMSDSAPTESSAAIRARVALARKRQSERYSGLPFSLNCDIPPALMKKYCVMSAFDRLGLSARAHDKLLKVALTIADLAGSGTIEKQHIAAAMQFRAIDSKYWERI